MFTQISVASFNFKQVNVSKSRHSSYGITILHLFVIWLLHTEFSVDNIL
jgi:hypothetical protein